MAKEDLREPYTVVASNVKDAGGKKVLILSFLFDFILRIFKFQLI